MILNIIELKLRPRTYSTLMFQSEIYKKPMKFSINVTPITSHGEINNKFEVLKVNARSEEYEGNKSKYIRKLPSTLSDNKEVVNSKGSSSIEKISEK